MSSPVDASAFPTGGPEIAYPIHVEPNREHAEMLLSRVGFLREELVPLA